LRPVLGGRMSLGVNFLAARVPGADDGNDCGRAMWVRRGMRSGRAAEIVRESELDVVLEK